MFFVSQQLYVWEHSQSYSKCKIKKFGFEVDISVYYRITYVPNIIIASAIDLAAGRLHTHTHTHI